MVSLRSLTGVVFNMSKLNLDWLHWDLSSSSLVTSMCMYIDSYCMLLLLVHSATWCCCWPDVHAEQEFITDWVAAAWGWTRLWYQSCLQSGLLLSVGQGTMCCRELWSWTFAGLVICRSYIRFTYFSCVKSTVILDLIGVNNHHKVDVWRSHRNLHWLSEIDWNHQCLGICGMQNVIVLLMLQLLKASHMLKVNEIVDCWISVGGAEGFC